MCYDRKKYRNRLVFETNPSCVLQRTQSDMTCDYLK